MKETLRMPTTSEQEFDAPSAKQEAAANPGLEVQD